MTISSGTQRARAHGSGGSCLSVGLTAQTDMRQHAWSTSIATHVHRCGAWSVVLIHAGPSNGKAVSPFSPEVRGDMSEPLMEFTSHIEGRNAKVASTMTASSGAAARGVRPVELLPPFSLSGLLSPCPADAETPT